jgi:hypothetical protein
MRLSQFVDDAIFSPGPFYYLSVILSCFHLGLIDGIGISLFSSLALGSVNTDGGANVWSQDGDQCNDANYDFPYRRVFQEPETARK